MGNFIGVKEEREGRRKGSAEQPHGKRWGSQAGERKRKTKRRREWSRQSGILILPFKGTTQTAKTGYCLLCNGAMHSAKFPRDGARYARMLTNAMTSS